MSGRALLGAAAVGAAALLGAGAAPAAAVGGDQVTFGDPAGNASTDGPFAIAGGPDGNLWYTAVLSDRIGRITPA
ncbi:MAG: hypothetical protein KDB10_01795, partial [Acidimicrobiales bacterium]|nr:hypothetical protein [Acidimicrobiales bacterium]